MNWKGNHPRELIQKEHPKAGAEQAPLVCAAPGFGSHGQLRLQQQQLGLSKSQACLLHTQDTAQGQAQLWDKMCSVPSGLQHICIREGLLDLPHPKAVRGAHTHPRALLRMADPQAELVARQGTDP